MDMKEIFENGCFSPVWNEGGRKRSLRSAKKRFNNASCRA